MSASNSILCIECLRWVHKRCSGISGKLKSNVDFHCRRCFEESPVETVSQREVETEPNVKLECGKASYWGKHLTVAERG